MLAEIAFVLAAAQEPSRPPDLAVIGARLGPCSADFTVTGADGKPVYAAIIHVRIRYGFLSLKRMDLEVGTNSEGKARVETLPSSARRLVYEITKDTAKATVEQDLAIVCRGTYDLSLKEMKE